MQINGEYKTPEGVDIEQLILKLRAYIFIKYSDIDQEVSKDGVCFSLIFRQNQEITMQIVCFAENPKKEVWDSIVRYRPHWYNIIDNRTLKIIKCS